MSAAATLHLYEIADARAILDQWLAETEGELTPELEQLLNETNAAADEKIERVALYIRELKARAAAVKEERDRLAAIVTRHEKAATSLMGYLQAQMNALGKDKVQGLLATVAFQKNPPSVVGELDETSLLVLHDEQPELVKHIDTYQLDRRAVLELHKAGKPLPQGLTVEQSRSLRIR